MTQIIKCTCQHAYQDSLYGVGNRMANEMRTGQLKCTVCGSTGTGKGIPPIAKAAAVTAAVQKKDKPASKDKKIKGKPVPKPKIDRSRKMNKK